MHDMKKLMEMKGKSKMSPLAKEAKLGVLGDLKKMAGEMMAGDLKGMKKVTVASPDSEGLSEGLEKAQEIIGEKDESEDEEGYEDKVAAEYGKYMAEPSLENIESLIQCLEEKKAEMSGGSEKKEPLLPKL